MKLVDTRKFTVSEVMFLRKIKSEMLAKNLGVSQTTILEVEKTKNFNERKVNNLFEGLINFVHK